MASNRTTKQKEHERSSLGAMVWRRVRPGGGREDGGGVGVWDGGGYADLSRQGDHEMGYIGGVGSEWREGGERGLERSLEALSGLPKRGLDRDKC